MSSDAIPADSAKTWPLSPEELEKRKAAYMREKAEVAKKRSALGELKLELARVKEAIKQTELGQQQEGLKTDIKDTEDSIAAVVLGMETLGEEIATGRTKERQPELPGVDGEKKAKGKKKTPPEASPDGELPGAMVVRQDRTGVIVDAELEDAQQAPLPEQHLTLPAPSARALPPGPDSPESIDRREEIRAAILRTLETSPGPGDRVAVMAMVRVRFPAEARPSDEEIGAVVAALVKAGLVLDHGEQLELAPQPGEPRRLAGKARRPGLLPSLTAAQTRKVFELLRQAPGNRLPAADVRAAVGAPANAVAPVGVATLSSSTYHDWELGQLAPKPGKAKAGRAKGKAKAPKAKASKAPSKRRGAPAQALDSFTAEQWRRLRRAVAAELGFAPEALCSESALVQGLHLPPVAAPALLRSFQEAGAVDSREIEGTTFWGLSAAVTDDDPEKGLHRLVLEHLAGLVNDAPRFQRCSEVAELLELPRALVLSVAEDAQAKGLIDLGDGLADPLLLPAARPAKKAAE